MPDAARRLLGRLERLGTALENLVLVLLLAAMMIIAVGQIALRLFFDSGFVWADELLKLMVLWIAMVASIAASRSNRHLRIDVLSHFVPERFARVPRMIVDLFAALICGLLAWHSMRFILLSLEFGDTVLVGIPSWTAHGIVPLAFALMSYRFLLSSIGASIAVIRNEPAEAPGI